MKFVIYTQQISEEVHYTSNGQHSQGSGVVAWQRSNSGSIYLTYQPLHILCSTMSTTEAPQYQATWIGCTGFCLLIAFLDTIAICLFIYELHIFFKSLLDLLTRAHAVVEEIECNSQKLWRQVGVQSSHTYNTLHKESMHEFNLMRKQHM
jgi:hypothetical protein